MKLLHMKISNNFNITLIKWRLLQYVIYDYSSFIADVGGYLGLLLGQSLYSFYLMMEERARVWKKIH